MSADTMLSPDATWTILQNGPIYANFEKSQPTKVWVVEREPFVGDCALETKPFEGIRGLVWALVEATCVSRSRSGISVIFWKGGATGWYPFGNVRLPE